MLWFAPPGVPEKLWYAGPPIRADVPNLGVPASLRPEEKSPVVGGPPEGLSEGVRNGPALGVRKPPGLDEDEGVEARW